MDDHTAAIRADGGAWAETEILGNMAIVKVRATAATLTTIADATGFTRLPLSVLDNSLASLSTTQRTAIRNKLNDMGYSVAEIQARFGSDLSIYTLGDVLRFAASRRLKPRYDAATDTIILDGAQQPCRSVTSVDAEIQTGFRRALATWLKSYRIRPQQMTRRR
jgi:hypothetical protein